MVNPELVAKFRKLGVDIERVNDVAVALVHLFDGMQLTPIQRLATLRLVEQAVRFTEEVDGIGFHIVAEELVKLLQEGDAEARAMVEAEERNRS
jgi:hypothetical protein